MEDRQGVEVPTDLNVIFGPDVEKLWRVKRQKLALEYIDKFSFIAMDEALFAKAGVNKKTWDKRHQRKLYTDQPELIELEARVNYCQYLFQENGEQPLLPFTELDLVSDNRPENVANLQLGKRREIRVVTEPFFINRDSKMVKQHGYEEKRQALTAMQMINRANSSIGEPVQMPSPNMVAVLYFTRPAPIPAKPV